MPLDSLVKAPGSCCLLGLAMLTIRPRSVSTSLHSQWKQTLTKAMSRCVHLFLQSITPITAKRSRKTDSKTPPNPRAEPERLFLASATICTCFSCFVYFDIGATRKPVGQEIHHCRNQASSEGLGLELGVGKENHVELGKGNEFSHAVCYLISSTEISR
ncbi:hypothetical protein V6N11_008062 [Hibiscus sabdariffa]|uniref:Uncharacterized protein n=1 Tax=Hibiscus sabdariffa TaxID=183260 RepID=A0ABR2PZI1_9ROSI